MLKQVIDQQQIGVPCPQCGRKATCQIGRLRAQGHFRCRTCRQDVDVDMQQFDEEVRALEQQLKAMGFR